MVLENKKKTIGNLGEKIASEFLENKGYKILDRNYASNLGGGIRKGEIDIVAKQKETICFVEVKTLTNNNPVIPAENKFNPDKRNKIIKTAESWLMERKIPLDNEQRLDLIVVRIDLKNKKAKIRHLENIF